MSRLRVFWATQACTIPTCGYNEGGEEARHHSFQRRCRRIVPAFLGGVCSVGWGIFISSNCESNGARHKNLPEICIGGGAWQQCSPLHRHPQGSHDAQARRISNEIYFLRGVGDKWKIVWSNCIRPGCACDSTFALSRTRSSAHWRGRMRIPVRHIPM